MIVPMLNFKVHEERIPTSTGYDCFTQTDLEQYWLTPDGAQAGSEAKKLSFTDAISLFIV